MHGRDKHPLASLLREHQLIASLVESLGAYAQRLLKPHPAGGDPRDLAAFTRVFRSFADELHHEKEEEILQPLLSRNGFHWEDGMLAEVRAEHERERYMVEVLGQAAECELAWSDEDRRSIAATALSLVEFQRQHMHKENDGLFPDIARRLSPDALEELRGELDRFDRVPRHLEVGAELLLVADNLIECYAPARPVLGAL